MICTRLNGTNLYLQARRINLFSKSCSLLFSGIIVSSVAFLFTRNYSVLDSYTLICYVICYVMTVWTTSRLTSCFQLTEWGWMLCAAGTGLVLKKRRSVPGCVKECMMVGKPSRANFFTMPKLLSTYLLADSKAARDCCFCGAFQHFSGKHSSEPANLPGVTLTTFLTFVLMPGRARGHPKHHWKFRFNS